MKKYGLSEVIFKKNKKHLNLEKKIWFLIFEKCKNRKTKNRDTSIFRFFLPPLIATRNFILIWCLPTIKPVSEPLVFSHKFRHIPCTLVKCQESMTVWKNRYQPCLLSIPLVHSTWFVINLACIFDLCGYYQNTVDLSL